MFNMFDISQFSDKMSEMVKFRQKLVKNAMNAGTKFNMGSFYEEMMKTEEKLLKGIDVLVNMPQESVATDTLEKEVIFTEGKLRLYHYKPLVAKKNVQKTPTLIVYALVNRQYMMDIQPDRSVIKTFLENGMDCYVIDWGYPTAEDMYLTLDDHINWYMDDCVECIRKKAKVDKINLMGICQGGTFSAIYTALHAEKVKNLITMVVPIDFSTDDALLFRWSKHLNIDSLVDAYGVVPGSVMNSAYLILKPLSLSVDKYVSMSEKMDDPEYMANFMRMEKWIFDSPGQVGETLRQFVKDLYQGNKLIKGKLVLDGRTVDLKNITMPVLCICADYDHLVPLSASKPLMNAIASEDKEFMSFKTGHIGMYVSAKSQKEIAPKIVEWVKAR